MIEIDIQALLKKLNDLNVQYSSFEEIQMNLFSDLNSICSVDWQDGNSITLGKCIYEDKIEASKFRLDVWNKISIVKFIYDRFDDISKKIKCNLNNKDTILNSIENCISQIDSILLEFDKIDFSFYYPEKIKIKNFMTKYKNCRSKLASIQDDFKTIYSNIESIESEIEEKINELEDIKIMPFTYELNAEKEVANKAVLDYNLFEIDVKKVSLYKDEENKTIKKICDLLMDFDGVYSSSNVSKYKNSIEKVSGNADEILIKRNSYIDVFDKVPPIYGIMESATKNTFEGDNND